eukprot:scaffold13563_cov267-Alexandrium_tamarense.AAC.16
METLSEENIATPEKVEDDDINKLEEDADDTATESYNDGEDEENSQFSYNDDEYGRLLPMPPLKYARIMGSLPRQKIATDANTSSPSALSVDVTCSTMGQVILRPSPLNENAGKDDESTILSASRHGDKRNIALATTNALEWDEYDDDDEADRSSTKTHQVLALGFEDGKVRLVDAHTGGSVLFGSTLEDGGAWFINPSTAKRQNEKDYSQRIVALSFDSSSTYLAALNANGDAAVFGPLVWGRQSRRTQRSDAVDGASHNIGSFLWGGNAPSQSEPEADKNKNLRPPFALIKPPTATLRFSYIDPQKESLGSTLRLGGATLDSEQTSHPKCMVLDPAFGKRKERALIVGFDDGRLVLSKLQAGVTSGIGSGFTSFFGGGGSGGNAAGGGSNAKKTDSVLYQGIEASSTSGDQLGIETIAWRGGLVAWADSRCDYSMALFNLLDMHFLSNSLLFALH